MRLSSCRLTNGWMTVAGSNPVINAQMQCHPHMSLPQSLKSLAVGEWFFKKIFAMSGITFDSTKNQVQHFQIQFNWEDFFDSFISRWSETVGKMRNLVLMDWQKNFQPIFCQKKIIFWNVELKPFPAKCRCCNRRSEIIPKGISPNLKVKNVSEDIFGQC